MALDAGRSLTEYFVMKQVHSRLLIELKSTVERGDRFAFVKGKFFIEIESVKFCAQVYSTMEIKNSKVCEGFVISKEIFVCSNKVVEIGLEFLIQRLDVCEGFRWRINERKDVVSLMNLFQGSRFTEGLDSRKNKRQMEVLFVSNKVLLKEIQRHDVCEGSEPGWRRFCDRCSKDVE